MARNHGPLHDLARWAAHDTDRGWARRAASRWADHRPALAGYRTVGDIIRAGQTDPATEAGILAALLAQPAGDTLARQTALAILEPRLRRCLNRTIGAGTPADTVDELEAELVAEAVAALNAPEPPPDPARLAECAWNRARNRARQRARAARREVDLDRADRRPAADLRSASEQAAAALVDAVHRRRISRSAAQAVYTTRVAGWPTDEAARRLGCHPDALRARRARAIRQLAA